MTERLFGVDDACLQLAIHKTKFYQLLILLCHKCRCLFSVIGAAQHGHLDSVVTRATASFRRIVAIEFGTWRSGRSGGSSGLITFA
jgi:hypothetical protein